MGQVRDNTGMALVHKFYYTTKQDFHEQGDEKEAYKNDDEDEEAMANVTAVTTLATTTTTTPKATTKVRALDISLLQGRDVAVEEGI